MFEDRLAAEIPHLRRYARALTRERESADDLVQDTMERALRKRYLWRPTGRLRSWLFRMLYRLYLNQRPRRRREYEKVVALDDVRQQLGRPPSHDQQLHCRDVMQAVDDMPEAQRAVLILVALEHPSYADGARMLGIAVGTFRSRLSRARRELRQRVDAPDASLERAGEEYG